MAVFLLMKHHGIMWLTGLEPSDVFPLYLGYTANSLSQLDALEDVEIWQNHSSFRVFASTFPTSWNTLLLPLCMANSLWPQFPSLGSLHLSPPWCLVHSAVTFMICLFIWFTSISPSKQKYRCCEGRMRQLCPTEHPAYGRFSIYIRHPLSLHFSSQILEVKRSQHGIY